MAKAVASNMRPSSFWGNSRRKLSGSSSTFGKCSAGRVDRVKWELPARTCKRSPSSARSIGASSPSARQISDSLRAGTVILPGWSTCTGVTRPTSSTSILVPVSVRVLSSASNNTLDSTGMVCFFSTTPAMLCSGVSRDSRLIVSFMALGFSYRKLMLLVLPPRSGGQQSHKVLVVFPDARIGFLQLDYLLAGVQHRGVVPAAKGIANFRQTVVGQFLGQRHRHLAGPGDGTGPALGQQIRYLDLVILRHGTLDIINTDLLFMQCQQVFQAFPDKRRSNLRASEVSIRYHQAQRAFELPDV